MFDAELSIVKCCKVHVATLNADIEANTQIWLDYKTIDEASYCISAHSCY